MRVVIRFKSALCACLLLAFVAPVNSNSTVRHPQATHRYTLDAAQSKFIAHASAGGLLWFMGHDHLVAARDFTGEAEINPDSINPASLRLVVKADSMVETSSVFTEQQKQIINKELGEIVLLPATYPEIVFKSSDVSGKALGGGQYDLKIGGELTLHGVTRHISSRRTLRSPETTSGLTASFQSIVTTTKLRRHPPFTAWFAFVGRSSLPSTSLATAILPSIEKRNNRGRCGNPEACAVNACLA